MGGHENLHAENVKHDLHGKNVLVTGGTQGIGSGSPFPNSETALI
jgi:FlaA1/EpsC-like NDP-sugar epimerase